ncbi:type I-C CRISPR-associated protein Cas8c/Csd1 [Caproiciproducens faecalis]|uniref:Type I-C CRISPR-associated protein Cas8c/Csd1 n=1 Tax=Caproiciproducens faecalis TaxID=2820301 RepID=A0ABS7DJK7_9FIRM|nr:type I-C CRISPR-associated protein Cas8c/Csd1 [Caproiciproducens faecalis]MBW7571494.1 type I-C CRISPR-associated protein Cas8c/Csd1 [Caproiciproducens faecalis]
MAWMNTLYQTYEANAHMAGKRVEGAPLSLVAHMTANAQIEILINQDGVFCGAHSVEKENAKTIIPVTEASASRSSGDAPHALCDTLSYVAGDFGQYLSDKKLAGKTDKKFEKYITALQSWAESPFSHPKVRAVYAYAAQKQTTRDLILSKVLETANGKLSDKKVSGSAYEKALVRFRVVDSEPDAVWQDESLFHCYTQYYVNSQSGEKDICYLTGKTDTISVNHPKGIVAANYGAKLISSNDKDNFTFRGRFSTSEQACTVSYEATQKVHSALTWLAARQGVTAGTQDKRTYICWNPNGKKVVDLEDPFGLEDDDEPRAYTEEEYKKRLMKTLNGYRGELDNNDEIVVIGLDAATTGRLSITYYNELKGTDFYDRLTDWGKTCCWYFTKFSLEKKPYAAVLTPLTKQIVLCAFGTEQGNFLEISDKVMKEQYQRILYCMLDRQPLPRDVVHAVAQRASMPQAYSYGNRERILSTACALIAKYYNDKGVNVKMALDHEDTDRSYLFGRLLAVLEKTERSAFTVGETRETNAIRLQSAYVNHPMSTWRILEDKLNPYFQRINPGSRKYYKDLISEITEKIVVSNADMLNRPLEERYLIGYYLQRAELNASRSKDENKKEDQ